MESIVSGTGVLGQRLQKRLRRKKRKKMQEPEIINPLAAPSEYQQQQIADYKARQLKDQMTVGSTILTGFNKQRPSMMGGY